MSKCPKHDIWPDPNDWYDSGQGHHIPPCTCGRDLHKSEKYDPAFLWFYCIMVLVIIVLIFLFSSSKPT